MARLTVHPPNHKAADLASFIKKQAKKELGLSGEEKCCSGFWIIFALVSLVATIAGLATGLDVGTALFLLFLLVILPLLKIYSIQMEEYYKYEPVSNAAYRALQVQLNERMRTQVLKKPALTREYGEPTLDEEESQVAGLISNQAFTALKSSGYASTTAWAIYASMWPSFIAQVSETDNLRVLIEQLHSQWLEIIQGLAVAADSFVSNLDARRISANQRLQRYNQDNAMGQLGELFGLNVPNEVVEVKESLQSIRRDVMDIKKQFNEGTIKMNIRVDAVTTGIHPITARRQWMFVVLLGILFGLLAIAGFALIPLAGALFLVFGIFFTVAFVLMQMPMNPAFNCFEDLIIMETALREALDKAMQVASPSAKDFSTVLVELRTALMESYYDALAIHLQTEVLTYGIHDTTLQQINLNENGTTGTDLEEGQEWILEEGRG